MASNRRQFLRSIGIGSTGILLAGCSGEEETERGTTADERETEAPTATETDRPTTPTTTEEPTTDGISETETDEPEERPPVEQTPVIELTAGGEDLGPRADHGHFYYDTVSGDFDVSVRCLHVGGSTTWEKAGIMVRTSLEPDAPHVMIRREPGTGSIYESSPVSIQVRSEPGVATDSTYGFQADWLRVVRDGETISVLGSKGGADWEEYATFTVGEDVPLGEEAFVGLAGTALEDYEEQSITATFSNLEGLDPTDNVDLGEPAVSGSVAVRDDLPVVNTAVPEAAADSMDLVGSISLPDGLEAECSFQYRTALGEEWREADSVTVGDSGWFTVPIDAESRRIYAIRALADVPDAPEPTAGTPTEGSIIFDSTPSPADPVDYEDSDASLSAGVSRLGMADGFAEPAPWLDDDTPIVRITDTDPELLDRAWRIPHERLVVFETSGTIPLESETSIRTDKCYVAGQTAPSPGITLIREGIQIAADDCVLQHIRVRPGDDGQDSEFAPTSILTQDGRENNVVDHCTTTWGIDENLTIGRRTSATTYSNNLVAEALRDSTHVKGEHSMGSLINPNANDVALLGNVWTRNVDRNPRLRLASTDVVANNLIFHYKDGCWLDPQTRASIVGNEYLSPISGQPTVMTKSLDYGEGIPKAYVADNHTDGDVPMVGPDVEELAEPPLWPDGFEAMAVGDVLEHNLANAGARPADRTATDERIVEAVRSEDGQFIDSQAEVGGYPDLPENTHEVDVPATGVRSWLREQSRAVEQS